MYFSKRFSEKALPFLISYSIIQHCTVYSCIVFYRWWCLCSTAGRRFAHRFGAQQSVGLSRPDSAVSSTLALEQREQSGSGLALWPHERAPLRDGSRLWNRRARRPLGVYCCTHAAHCAAARASFARSDRTCIRAVRAASISTSK